MNIEEFYDNDEARRTSAEFEFGDAWTDKAGNHYELSWVEATGELYLMLGPLATVSEDYFFGDVLSMNEPVEGLTVKVIAQIPTVDEVERILDGWQSAMAVDDSIQWLAARFTSTPPN